MTKLVFFRVQSTEPLIVNTVINKAKVAYEVDPTGQKQSRPNHQYVQSADELKNILIAKAEDPANQVSTEQQAKLRSFATSLAAEAPTSTAELRLFSQDLGAALNEQQPTTDTQAPASKGIFTRVFGK